MMPKTNFSKLTTHTLDFGGFEISKLVVYSSQKRTKKSVGKFYFKESMSTNYFQNN